MLKNLYFYDQKFLGTITKTKPLDQGIPVNQIFSQLQEQSPFFQNFTQRQPNANFTYRTKTL